MSEHLVSAGQETQLEIPIRPRSGLSGEDLDQVSHLLPHLARLDADEIFQIALESAITSISAFKAHPAS